ncbi:hypothetical protein C4D60_Mb04t37870 [Musa balbisiana]|uniref:Uncharacterized protein n=1 Tax=Musa balbisiana TaxID=52838 RepID=A0A4S8KHT2_MUSBA|nr:hypothetical protein C4D60_Mb04t37870 [Musa balbisiana]
MGFSSKKNCGRGTGYGALFCCITCPKVLLSDHQLKDSDLQTRNVHHEDKSFRDMYVICRKE